MSAIWCISTGFGLAVLALFGLISLALLICALLDNPKQTLEFLVTIAGLCFGLYYYNLPPVEAPPVMSVRSEWEAYIAVFFSCSFFLGMTGFILYAAYQASKDLLGKIDEWNDRQI
jgi:hypothetical protein